MYTSQLLILSNLPQELMALSCHNTRMPSSQHFSPAAILTKCRLVVWILAAALMSYATAAPIGSPQTSTIKPKWQNPCNIPGHTFDAKKDLEVDISLENIDELYEDIIHSANIAKKKGKRAKDQFVAEAFDEADFENGVQDQRERWLPEIPKITDEYLKKLKREEAFKSAYKILQYFGVGLEQAVIDQLDEKRFLRLFTESENELVQILCHLQRSMTILGIRANPDVERKIMKHNRRNISKQARRNTRDFLILRDYVKAIEYVEKVFVHLKEKQL